jgi:hypothetical protein
MVYFLPNEFLAPANQVVQEETSLDINDDEHLGGLMAQLVLAKQATFDKPAKNRHLRPLYLKEYVNGKPLTKMFIDGGGCSQRDAVHYLQEAWHGPRGFDANKYNSERFCWKSFRYQGLRARGPDDWVQDIAHDLLCHRRQRGL